MRPEQVTGDNFAVGTEQMVKGLRGFVSWRHPQVAVSEVEPSDDLPAYQV